MAAFESESQELRICFRYPIKEIAEAASLLNQAVTEHLFGNTSEAESLIRQADIPVISEWTESILGKNSKYALISAVREPSLPLAERIPVRMPNAQEMLQLHARDGYHCRFCGIPVIRKEVREKIRTAYPDALRWGKRNAERHAAFFAMWVQYDHLTPHSKGGTNDISNLVVTCSACNYGRGGFTLGEVRLRNPLERPPIKSSWDGLERFVRTSSNMAVERDAQHAAHFVRPSPLR